MTGPALTNSLRHCLTGETDEIVDRLLGEFLESCIGKNDMSIVSGMLASAAIIIATHCQRTKQDFDELSNLCRSNFDHALKIAGDRI